MSGVDRTVTQAPDDELFFYIDLEFNEVSEDIREELNAHFNFQFDDDDATAVEKSRLWSQAYTGWVSRTIVQQDEAVQKARELEPSVIVKWELGEVDIEASVHVEFTNRGAAALFKLTYC